MDAVHILRCCTVLEGSSVWMMMLLVFVGAIWVVLGVVVCNVPVYGHVYIHIYLYLCELCAQGLLGIDLQPHYWLDLGYGTAATSLLDSAGYIFS